MNESIININIGTIRKLATTVLINAYAINSPGLYNGKAGYSLALFEVAKLLNDDYLEDQAFELIQEALVSKTDDISFEQGLSGIGFVLKYLIDYQFIKADFDFFFKNKYQKISSNIHNKSYSIDSRLTPMLMGYLINDKASLYRLTTEVYQELTSFFNKSIFSLEKAIETNVFYRYETLLKVLSSSNEIIPNTDIASLYYAYSQFYTYKNNIQQFKICYYTRIYAIKSSNQELLNHTSQCLYNCVADCYMEPLALSHCIDWLYLLRKEEDRYFKIIELMEKQIIQINENELEKNLIRVIPPFTLQSGFENGIARWLLYIVYLYTQKKGEDTSRFDKLFI